MDNAKVMELIQLGQTVITRQQADLARTKEASDSSKAALDATIESVLPELVSAELIRADQMGAMKTAMLNHVGALELIRSFAKMASDRAVKNASQTPPKTVGTRVNNSANNGKPTAAEQRHAVDRRFIEGV